MVVLYRTKQNKRKGEYHRHTHTHAQTYKRKPEGMRRVGGYACVAEGGRQAMADLSIDRSVGS